MTTRSITLGHEADNGALSVDLMTLVDTRLLVQANSGGGKSGTLRLIAERASPFIQTIILDNDGEFATLREKVDMLLIGEGGEVPATVRSSGLLARRLLESQVSAVIDLYEMKLPQRREFVAGFLDALIALPRTLWRPTLIMIDEAHLYAPQSGEEISTQPVAALLAQGRKRGYCGIIATQRLSKLHKDVAAECNNVLIGRTWLDVDQVRAGDILGMSKADRIGLRDMPPQTFHGFGPAFSVSGVFTMRTDAVETTMPKAGHRFDVAVPPPSSKVRNLLAAEFANLPKEAEEQARDLSEARRQIADLRRQLTTIQSAAPDASTISKVQATAMRAARDEWRGRLATMEALRKSDSARLNRLRRLVTKASEAFADFAKELEADLSPSPEMPQGIEAAVVVARIDRKSAPVAREPHRQQPTVRALGEGELKLKGVQQRILDALAWLESIGHDFPSNSQLGAVALLDTTGGYFSNLAGPLSSAGLIERGEGRTRLTDAGRARAVAPERAPTLSAYHDGLRNRVLKMKSAARKTADILDFIVSHNGQPVTTAQIGAGIRVDHTGGYFSNLIGPLATVGLITRRDGVVTPTSVLFPEGLN